MTEVPLKIYRKVIPSLGWPVYLVSKVLCVIVRYVGNIFTPLSRRQIRDKIIDYLLILTRLSLALKITLLIEVSRCILLV